MSQPDHRCLFTEFKQFHIVQIYQDIKLSPLNISNYSLNQQKY